MLLAVTSDWHIDARFGSVSRWPEFQRFVEWLESEIRSRSVDWLLVPGDFFDPGRVGDILYSSRLIQVATRLHAACHKGSIWIPGNHDHIGHNSGVTTVSPLEEVAKIWPTFYVTSQPATYELDDDVIVVAIPYPSGDRDGYQRAWNDVLAYLRQTRGDEMTRIFLGHHTVTGAAMGTESMEMAKGGDHVYPVDEIRSALGLSRDDEIPGAIFLNGHYHKPQTTRFQGVDIHIPGSPLRLDAGERDDGCEIILLKV
jgi:DNA repair exonuclease SbcCD nuclease subunit